VHDALAVRGIESIGHFNRKREQALLVHRPPFNRVFQRLASQAFHHDEQMSIMLANLMDGADVGMVQRRGCASLPTKALQSLRVLRGIVGQKLQRHEAAQQRVFRLINHSHSAAAEEFDDPVVGDGLADHGRMAPQVYPMGQPWRPSHLRVNCGYSSMTRAR
jgi:hypothetical protein